MKKSVLLIGFLLATCASFSQEVESPSRFSLGPSIGTGHAFLIPFNNPEYMPGWSAGLIAVYGPVNWWGVGIDARYSVEGGKIRNEAGERVTHLNYIRVPVKSMFFFGNSEDDFRPKLTVGPCVGFLVGEEDTYDVKANDFDFGVTGSAGFNYRLYRGTWLNLDLSYYQGLLDVRTHTGVTELNGNLALNVGVAFGI